MHINYPDGIDLARGVTSTVVETIKPGKHGMSEAAAYLKIVEQNKLFGGVTSPGEILGIKRVHKLQALEKQKLREERLKLMGGAGGSEEAGESHGGSSPSPTNLNSSGRFSFSNADIGAAAFTSAGSGVATSPTATATASSPAAAANAKKKKKKKGEPSEKSLMERYKEMQL